MGAETLTGHLYIAIELKQTCQNIIQNMYSYRTGAPEHCYEHL